MPLLKTHGYDDELKEFIKENPDMFFNFLTKDFGCLNCGCLFDESELDDTGSDYACPCCGKDHYLDMGEINTADMSELWTVCHSKHLGVE